MCRQKTGSIDGLRNSPVRNRRWRDGSRRQCRRTILCPEISMKRRLLLNVDFI